MRMWPISTRVDSLEMTPRSSNRSSWQWIPIRPLVRNRSDGQSFILLGNEVISGGPAMSFVMKLGAVLAVLWFDAAVAQEGYRGHDHDKWHRGLYQTLERPDTKSPCCNLTDCRPTSGREVDGHYEVKVNGAWVSVPPGKILKRSAPDLGFHVCAPFKFDGRPDHLYCVVVPPET
jgi:hypothetical protein